MNHISMFHASEQGVQMNHISEQGFICIISEQGFVESLNLCLDDRIGLSGMLVYHLLYLLLVFSGITSIFLSKLSLGIKI